MTDQVPNGSELCPHGEEFCAYCDKCANEKLTSKDQLRIAELEAECNRWADLSNQRDDREHRLRTTLRGIASCSTCERCRGAATLALGGAFACIGGCGVEVPSKDAYCSACFLKARAEANICSQLRALPSGYRLLGYTAAEELERLQRIETAWLEIFGERDPENAAKWVADLLWAASEPRATIRDLVASAYKDGYGADLADDRDLSERTHELMRRLSRPAHEREGPHCSTCECPAWYGGKVNEEACKQLVKLNREASAATPEPDTLRRYVHEQLGHLAGDDNRPAEALIRLATERLAAQPPGDSIVALDSALVEINDMIVHGHLTGDGTDQTAQRNGIILAANKLREIIDRATPPPGAEG